MQRFSVSNMFDSGLSSVVAIVKPDESVALVRERERERKKEREQSRAEQGRERERERRKVG